MEVSAKCFTVETTWAHPLCKLQPTKAKSLSIVCIAGVVEADETGRKEIQKGNRVAGLLPSIFDYDKSVFSRTIVNPHFFTEIPPEVNPTDVAAALLPALRAYTALGSFIPVQKDDVCLILCLDDINQIIIAHQVCSFFGAKTLIWCSSEKIKEKIRSQLDPLPEIICLDFYSLSSLANICLEKTSGKGVDKILEFPAKSYSSESSTPAVPACDVLPCLAVGGQWVTSQISLQLTSHESNLMLLKGGSLAFLFESVWLLSPLKIGTYQRILGDIMVKLKEKLISPNVETIVDCSDLPEQKIPETIKSNGAVVHKLC